MPPITFEDLCAVVAQMREDISSAQASADEALGYLDGFNGSQKVMIGIDQCLDFIEEQRGRIDMLEDEIELLKENIE